MDCLAWLAPPGWSVYAGLLAVLLYKFLTWNYGTFKRMGLPGPRPIPLLGTMLPFLKRPIGDIDLKYLKKYGTVYGMFTGRTPNMVVGDAAMLKDIFIKEFSHFVNKKPPMILQKPLNRIMSFLRDDHWRHVRAIVSPTHTSGKLKQMVPLISNCADRLVAHIDKQDGAALQIKPAMASYTVDVIAGTAFGLDVRSLEQPNNPFFRHAKEFFAFANGRSPRMLLGLVLSFVSTRLANIVEKLGITLIPWRSLRYMEIAVEHALNNVSSEEKRQNFASMCRGQLVDIDKVSRDSIRKAHDGRPWTTEGLVLEEITSNSIIFLMAGYEPVSTLLTFFCYAMATNPEAQRKVYEDIANNILLSDISYENLKNLQYLDMCIDETLRMYPPVQRLDRECKETITLNGIRIPEGMQVIIPVKAVHYNPDYWPDPHAFQPERFLPERNGQRCAGTYLPFGIGPRTCLGMRLALLEAKAVIVKIMLKFSIEASSDTPKPPLLQFAASTRLLTPAQPLSLIFRKR